MLKAVSYIIHDMTSYLLMNSVIMSISFVPFSFNKIWAPPRRIVSLLQNSASGCTDRNHKGSFYPISIAKKVYHAKIVSILLLPHPIEKVDNI